MDMIQCTLKSTSDDNSSKQPANYTPLEFFLNFSLYRSDRPEGSFTRHGVQRRHGAMGIVPNDNWCRRWRRRRRRHRRWCRRRVNTFIEYNATHFMPRHRCRAVSCKRALTRHIPVLAKGITLLTFFSRSVLPFAIVPQILSGMSDQFNLGKIRLCGPKRFKIHIKNTRGIHSCDQMALNFHAKRN